MTPDQWSELVKRTLYQVAPDLEGQPIQPMVRFNEQFEFDSMDFLSFIAGLHRATGLELPEKDYPRLTTLESAVAYLTEKRPA
ncbi:MAG: acyl carrier protein [Rhizobiales bacterium]|nr:acyl carrier protein [Hyphomicrobiales bacterium]MBI3672031.1 acyl carrier protein [Hyphomicrobiales bacterium]